MSNDTQRLTLTRTFDAPRDLVWKAWTDPKFVAQWWGPKDFTIPVCNMDFRVGGKFLLCMRGPNGWEGWTGGEYHEIVPQEKIVFSMYFADAEGNKVQPEDIGVEHKADTDAFDSVLFEDAGNGRTRVTYMGNEAMEDAAESGQLEAMNQSFDKCSAVLRG